MSVQVISRARPWLISLAVLLAGLAAIAALALATRASAHAPSGAIFTTLSDGTEVNANIFSSKEDVYLDGGPGPGAPQGAAGLDDGTYVFQVTDPSADVLLSSDPAGCRLVTVAGGVFTGVVAFGGCEHVTGNDVDHPPAKTVQLFPFNQTPNPGGVFKAHIVEVGDFLAGCVALGNPGLTGLAVVDCGLSPNNHHGFVSAHSKTDNFKVNKGDPHEIDIRFFRDKTANGRYDAGEELIPALQTFWTDTLGVRNLRWSNTEYYTFAHVEAAETGRHYINIVDNADCDVGQVTIQRWDHGAQQSFKNLRKGPQNVAVTFSARQEKYEVTYYVDVVCK